MESRRREWIERRRECIERRSREWIERRSREWIERRKNKLKRIEYRGKGEMIERIINRIKKLIVLLIQF